ncbi:hypothetical protein [Flagellimonas flava]|uniref:Antibiotic biosynthesis monooxygenase n=1 Tax=Flagellimonas flava TaxID=570519 RepID=A0A1M5I6Y6_9FLAO|nr:hypothetical protein [Allomuricauda flava]SHG23533.1 hypothetical protein SAMN04488116_0452 [Allomuricauda flava]
MNNNQQVMEWAPFTIKEDVSETELLEVSKALQTDFLQNLKGFVRRELLIEADRKYIDVVYWKNMDAARRAMDEAKKSPACFAYFSLMEEADNQQPNQGVFHYQIASSY